MSERNEVTEAHRAKAREWAVKETNRANSTGSSLNPYWPGPTKEARAAYAQALADCEAEIADVMTEVAAEIGAADKGPGDVESDTHAGAAEALRMFTKALRDGTWKDAP